jgi:alpha-N-acetylglucosamine transferase
MELEYFTKLERIQHNDITIFMITVLRELPTPLQWQFTIESFRDEFSRVKNEHNKFAFIMDVRKIGRISIAQIKEFVNLLESFTVVLQEYLVASSILTTKNSILAILFEIMKTFYKTKKPLLFVYDMQSAYDHIDSFDMRIVKDDVTT